MSNDTSQDVSDFTNSFDEEEGFGSIVARQFRDKPAVMTGIVGMIGALGYGYHRYKTKGALVSPTFFILQLRVGAQAVVVGCLTCGMVYQMIQQHVLKNKPSIDIKNG